jgi:hypothetical protein
MTIVEEVTRRAMDYVRGGMDARAAVQRACAEQLRSGVGDFSESWDTMTSWIPWILAGVAGVVVYRTGVKAHRAASDYISQKRRKFAAAKAAWDAVI